MALHGVYSDGGRRRPMQLLLVCGSVSLAFYDGRQNAPELQDAEEAVTAGVAAVGGKTQPAFHKNEGAIFHAFAGDMLEIKIAAAGTVREAFQRGRDPPGMKAPLAAVAAPGAQPGRSEHEVQNPVAVRAKAIVTAALRTDHGYPESVAQHTEKPVGGQAGENTVWTRQRKHNANHQGWTT
jgi:hypothetical protein